MSSSTSPSSPSPSRVRYLSLLICAIPRQMTNIKSGSTCESSVWRVTDMSVTLNDVMRNYKNTIDFGEGGPISRNQFVATGHESPMLGKVFACLVVILLSVLQAFGPFLHAHLRGSSGLSSGLHLHLNSPRLSGLALLERPAATTDEGLAISLSDEYRRQRDAASNGKLPPLSVKLDCLPVAIRQHLCLRYTSVAEHVRARAHKLPPANAPPLV